MRERPIFILTLYVGKIGGWETGTGRGGRETGMGDREQPQRLRTEEKRGG